MTISRRDFLLSTAGLAAGLALPRMTFASDSLSFSSTLAAVDRFFVLIRIPGGLDVTLGLDPWLLPDRPLATDMFVEYRHDQLIQTHSGYFLGPAASPLARYSDKMAVLNGVLMSEFDNGHEAALNYISTGNGQGKAPDLPVEIAQASGFGPYGVLTDGALTLLNRRIPFVRTTDILMARLKPDPADALAKTVQDHARTPLEKAIQDVVSAKEITAMLRQKLNEFEQSGPLVDVHAAMACFLTGAARQAKFSINASGNLDTHSNHEGTHLNLQRETLEKVAQIFTAFSAIPYGASGESLFDRTTFMVVSEFARTPALNAAKGKDHNPLTNSVLLAGAGISGGRSFGRSLLIEAARSATGSSYHMASPFDFQTGQPASSRQGADFIYPENVVATVATACGVDINKFNSVPKGTKLIPGVLKP